MNGDSTLQQRYERLRHRIEAACRAAGRPPGSVAILAVSKTFPASDVLTLAGLGQCAFGESYLQEGLAKIERCEAEWRRLLAKRYSEGCGARSMPSDHQCSGSAAPAVQAPRTALQWHFIGPLQSNKTRPIAEGFDWVQSVDRERIACRLSEQRPAERAPLNVCLQVNASGEATKSGCAPNEALALARLIAQLPRLRLRGVMGIPAPSDDPRFQREQCARLRAVFDQLNAAGMALDTLSMGMSDDLEAAIAEGANLVRIGSALFGQRPAPQSDSTKSAA